MTDKQSSVEFFYNEIFTAFSSKLSWSELEHLNNVKKQAKAMEKEQIKNSYHSGAIDGFNSRTTSISPNPEQYYNETFNNNE